MIHEYKKTFLSNYFDYNNSKVAEIADNLFEKIRQAGILPDYLIRSKGDRAKINAVDQSLSGPIFVPEPNFTFGYAYKGSRLTTEGAHTINLGKVYDVEFELFTKTDPGVTITLLENITITENMVISIHNVVVGNIPPSVIGRVANFRLTRVNEKVSLYINKEHINTVEVADVATTFSTIYELQSIT